MNQINWKASPEDAALIEKIVARACTQALSAAGITLDRLKTTMGITACHLNGTPLRLQAWLDSDEFNFAHDVVGIVNNMDRNTGKLRGHFLPRFSA